MGLTIHSCSALMQALNGRGKLRHTVMIVFPVVLATFLVALTISLTKAAREEFILTHGLRVQVDTARGE